MKEKTSGSQEKRCVSDVSILPYDLIFKILLLLPAKDLLRLSIVCKTWYRLINSRNFVEAHIKQCETVLTFLKVISKKRPNTFSIESKNGQFTLFEPARNDKWNSHIHFVEFEDGNGKISDLNICGFGDILATCDGLVLARNRTGTLLVLNPTTRKLLPLKSGTIVPPHDESYGFVFSQHTQEYKAVHIFRDRLRHIDSEILSLSTRSWHGGDVPSFGLFSDFQHKPVAASGVLYWLPGGNDVTYLVSMDINDEKFVTKDLPVNSSGMNDRLVEIGGFLNFIAQMTVYRIQIWTLKRDQCEDKWVKQYTINMDYDITGLVPVFATRNGRRLVFKQPTVAFYAYDIEEEEMESVEFNWNEAAYDKSFFPHMNTLATWENRGPLW